uniref:Reverse transcriptase/retrotransposon-derived protein RNase H-like domain-containing protein n=1 Tax=Gopherus agassizii TaxID=38772 RepID=A0A452HY16_9SAUR
MDLSPLSGDWLKPLHELTKEESEEPLHPNSEQIRAFKALKESLIRAPALGLPNYSKPFDLYVHEVKGVASGVLTQSFGNAPRPGHPGCLRNLAAAALLVEKSQEIVLGHPLTVQLPMQGKAC